MLYFYLAAEILIIILTLLAVLKNKNNTARVISYITLGIFFSTFVLLLPTQWTKEGVVYTSEPLYNILSSLLYSFKTLGGRQDIAQLETVKLQGGLRMVYVVFNYISFALAPILASSMIISFIGDMGDKIKFILSFAKKCYIFSELNTNSLSLAKGVKGQKGRKVIVFCDTKNADKDLIASARKIGAILFHKPCSNIKFSKRFKKYELCLIGDNEDSNISLAQSFILKKNKLRDYNITVNAFAESGISIDILESLMKKTPCLIYDTLSEKTLEMAINESKKGTKIAFCNTALTHISLLEKAFSNGFILIKKSAEKAKVDKDFIDFDINLCTVGDDNKVIKSPLKYYKGRLTEKWVEDPMRIRFVDEIALFCYNLIFNYPLYELPENRKEISAMLVGCGRLGMRMLKTIVWCGQTEGINLKLRVYDKNAKKIENELALHCPELDNYNIDFIEADIEQADFKEKIKESLDATFVCVATGSDELNIETSEMLYRIFRQNNIAYQPPIYTRVRKNIKSQNLNKNTYLRDRNINLFGTTESVFAETTLFNSKLENLAFAVHLCYCWALDSKKGSYEYLAARQSFLESEYNRRSSMAAALHISVKVNMAQKLYEKKCEEKGEKTFEEIIKDTDILDILAKNEHDRWNAFVRSEGYVATDIEEMKKYAAVTRSHKDDASKRHPCILSWEDLDEFQKKYNEIREEYGLKNSDFKEYDYKLVKEIPLILKKAQELEEN